MIIDLVEALPLFSFLIRLLQASKRHGMNDENIQLRPLVSANAALTFFSMIVLPPKFK